ncbi:DUF6515 family protein [Microbulbifer sp. TYP-18]|uniref:DUF6515 family protein n=1 Tax=Microbulbifer sp. TYP-18 TaxID=3230024 RepID=UPI0034C6C61D
MKTVKTLLGVIALLALGAFAFAPPADARSPGHDRHGHRYHSHHHHRPYHYPYRYPYRYHGGPRVSIGFTFPVLPQGFVSLRVGGHPYYYGGGFFYRPSPAGFVVVSAPLGASVVTLPASAVPVTVGGAVFYQYADAFYQWRPATGTYIVVPPPPGHVVTAAAAPAAAAPGTPGSPYTPGQVLETLPVGYSAEVINGIQYYRYGNTYFIPTMRDGREVFLVVRL